MPKNPVEDLADAFKTEAMKHGWPMASKIFEKFGIKTEKFEEFFDKRSNITVLSKEGNRQLVELSQAILDAIFKEFTSDERADEVMAQSQNIKIKSSIRSKLEDARDAMEKTAAKDEKLDKRLAMAGLQSFFIQLKNIDETAVLKAKATLEMNQAIKKGKSAQPASKLKPIQISQANDALNIFAVGAQKAKPNSPALKDLANKAAGILAKHGIKEEHLPGLFNNQDFLKLKNEDVQPLRDAILEALKAASK